MTVIFAIEVTLLLPATHIICNIPNHTSFQTLQGTRQSKTEVQ